MKDLFLTFSDAQAITASAASTNVIDLRAARQMAPGQELWINVHCVVAMTDAGSDSTVTVTVDTDDNAAFSSPTSSVQTLAVFAAVSAAGTMRKAPLVVIPTPERFLRLTYTVANGNLTTGSFTAYLSLTPQEATLYPAGYTFA